MKQITSDSKLDDDSNIDEEESKYEPCACHIRRKSLPNNLAVAAKRHIDHQAVFNRRETLVKLLNAISSQLTHINNILESSFDFNQEPLNDLFPKEIPNQGIQINCELDEEDFISHVQYCAEEILSATSHCNRSLSKQMPDLRKIEINLMSREAKLRNSEVIYAAERATYYKKREKEEMEALKAVSTKILQKKIRDNPEMARNNENELSGNLKNMQNWVRDASITSSTQKMKQMNFSPFQSISTPLPAEAEALMRNLFKTLESVTRGRPKTGMVSAQK